MKRKDEPIKKITYYGLDKKGGSAKIEQTDQGYPKGLFDRILKATRDDKGYITKFKIYTDLGAPAFLEVGDTKCIEVTGRYSQPGQGWLITRIMDPTGIINLEKFKTGGYKWGYELNGFADLYSFMKELNDLGSWDRYQDVKRVNSLNRSLGRLKNQNELLKNRISILKAQLSEYQEEEEE